MDKSSQKLTKKQRKALAFRVRKGKQAEHQPDVPEVDVVENDLGQTLPSPGLEAPITSKRKRDQGEGSETPTNKRRKKSPVASNNDLEKIKEKRARYILFVGNLSYKTNKESIEAHFASCPDPPTVRLLTPKPKGSNSGTATTKSKGCAFLEFQKPPSLQHALKLHHSLLDGRRINVELTSGGGGSSEKRKEVIKSRNRALEEERQRTTKSKQAKDENQVMTSEGQRHSTTSGAEIGDPSKPKTWSVAADGEQGRGGKRHMKKQQQRGGKSKPQKVWAPSGANAVSVG